MKYKPTILGVKNFYCGEGKLLYPQPSNCSEGSFNGWLFFETRFPRPRSTKDSNNTVDRRLKGEGTPIAGSSDVGTDDLIGTH